jgi:ribose-phosphate pyrophosphokinase
LITKTARENLYLVSPDAGVYNVAEHFKIENLIIASKHRDIKTGKIIRTDVPGLTQDPGRRNFVIVDDICDGGRTFLEMQRQ